ncbi:MAG: nucleotidyl transferase AbiEii/AbiGii toxin family protein [Cytophagales bacterium]
MLVKMSFSEILKDYTFVGGSALAVYLNHRKSEDIDLFTWQATLHLENIQKMLADTFKQNFKLINFSKTQIDCICEGVKVTFFANNWDQLKKNQPLVNYITIAEIDLLTGMKINTLFLRAKYRDYYDLYVLNLEKFSLKNMFEIAQIYVPSINLRLFQTALIFVDDIEDDSIKHLAPKYKITKQKISAHFVTQLKKQFVNT